MKLENVKQEHMRPMSVPGQMLSAGLAGCTADLFTYPLDTVKVWLQVRGTTSNVTNMTVGKSSSSMLLAKTLRKSVSSLQTGALSETARATMATASTTSKVPPTISIRANSKLASGFLPTTHLQVKKQPGSNVANQSVVRTIISGVRANGVTSLYGGIAAGLQRQIAFSSVRFGIYDSVKEFYMHLFNVTHDGKNIPIRILAGTTTAFVAVGMFQPTEVVKIRMQAQASASKMDRRYVSTLHAYRHLFQGGIPEAWRGIGANATRLGVVNVSELVTYDVVKEMIIDNNILNDNPYCHFLSAFISGFVTTLVASPFDVIKTRYMNSQQGKYAGVLDCTRKLLMNEGPRALYKGFVPAYLRLGSWNIVMFVSYEQYKRLWMTHVEPDL